VGYVSGVVAHVHAEAREMQQTGSVAIAEREHAIHAHSSQMTTPAVFGRDQHGRPSLDMDRV
jgi:hypothetical protein